MYIYRALEKRGFNAFAKGFDSDQPAQSAQTDLSRTFFLLVNFDHHSAYLGDRVIYPSVVSRNFYLMPGFFAFVGAVLKDIVYRNNLASVASRLSIERKILIFAHTISKSESIPMYSYSTRTYP